MLSTEQNDLITRTGPDTPAGKLMRRYWQPAALVDEFASNRPIKPVRLLGENLVMFRDGFGRYGLIERGCPHRGTDLAYGRLEDGGLRCAFHGWLFDVTGQCLETPAEPEGSRMCANIRQKAYPVIEKSGILFAYLGGGRAAGVPAFRLLHGALDPHLRVQGHDRLQLAAVARSRHRSRPHLVPASLLPRRGHVAGLRQAVPRPLDRFRHADDPHHARAPAAADRGRADRLRPAGRLAAPDQRRQHPCARDQPAVPARVLYSDVQRNDDHAVARADRRHPALLVRDLHQLRRAGRQGRDAPPAARALRTAGLRPAQEQEQRLRLRSARAGAHDLYRHGRRHQRARPVGLRVDGGDPGPHQGAPRPVRQGDQRLSPPAARGDRAGDAAAASR